jgi:hypothetical protein
VNLEPWLGMPAVDWPQTYRCVLELNTCAGVETHESEVRAGGTGMCADYQAIKDALARREICCDPGPPEPRRAPAAEPASPPGGPPAGPSSEPQYTDCSPALQEDIARAVNEAIDALEFSGCMERHGEDFSAWRERLRGMSFVCWDAITDQEDAPCAKAGRPRETLESFSRDHVTIFSRNIASCGCLHANLIHELAHGFDYGHSAPRNAYDLELDCAACGL